MAEPVLGLEDVALSDEDGRDGVPEPVQGHVGVTGTAREIAEPVIRRLEVCSS